MTSWYRICQLFLTDIALCFSVLGKYDLVVSIHLDPHHSPVAFSRPLA